MKRIHAALAATTLFLAAGALILGQAGDAVSQTDTTQVKHDHRSAPAPAPAVKGAPPRKGSTPRAVSLPGVPPGKPTPGGGVTTTITGEVMDPACFLEAGVKSIGPGHFQCAVDCVSSGQTLALYDRAIDRIYFIAGELPGRNPNAPLLPYIHQKVDVTGTVYHRSQAWGIVILKVVPHKGK